MDDEYMEPLVFKSETPQLVEYDYPSGGELEMIESSLQNDTMSKEKRGRGRPRKYKIDFSKLSLEETLNDTDENCEERFNSQIADTTMIGDTLLSIQKRGRGRPRKNIGANLNENSSSEGIKVHDIGIQEQTTDRSPTEQCPMPMSAEENNVSSEIKTDKQKRGRGRPPGSKICTVQNTGEQEDVTNEDCKRNKRGRGRPKKKRDINSTQNANIAKRGKGRPAGSKNKPKPIIFSKRSFVKFDNSEFKSSKKKKLGTKLGTKRTFIPPTRYIPKERFEESLGMLRDPVHPIWEEKNTACLGSIHRYYEEYRPNSTEKMLRVKYARQCTLRRDWVNLSKVLCLSAHGSCGQGKSYYPLLAKYGAICLAHTDKQQFNKFVNHLVNIDDGSTVLKKCTQFRGRHSQGVV